jgi:alanine racemase
MTVEERAPSRMVKNSSRIELSQSALRNNLAFIRERIGPHPMLSMVVKANAYGHGVEQMIPMARRCGVDHFSVASSFEAEEVRAAGGPDTGIMIMGILYDEDVAWAIEGGIEFFVFDLPRLRLAAEVAAEVGRPAKIHLELETGGNRTGLLPEEIATAASLVKKHAEHIQLVGVCTHLAGAETLATRFRIDRQVKAFEALRRQIHKRGLRPERFHMASSAAALTMPETVGLDMVRAGVCSYGFWPSADVYNLHLMRIGKARDNPLQRVLSWKTNIMHVKPVKRDEFIGYGTSYQASKDMQVAVIPLGYANGYPREMSNKGHVLVRGYKAPIVGLINMNLFMVDVTRIPDAAVGDTVVLIGRQKNNVINVSSFSEFSSALNTEFVCRLPTTIPRSAVR